MIVTDKAPYTKRQSLRYAEASNYYYDEIVGGTVAWNQLIQNGNFADTSNWSTTRCTLTASNNTGIATCTSAGWFRIEQSAQGRANTNHVYLFTSRVKYSRSSNALSYAVGFNPTNHTTVRGVSTLPMTIDCILKPTVNTADFWFGVKGNSDSDFQVGDVLTINSCMCIDLTLLFGSTIADYVYGLETASAGSGVAYVRKLFHNDYYAYDAGSLQSVKISEHKFTGKNLAKSVTASTSLPRYNPVGYAEIDCFMPSTTYTFSFEGTVGNVIYTNENIFTVATGFTIVNGRTYVTRTTRSTLPANQYFKNNGGWLIFKNSQDQSSANVFNDFQVEIGSTATSYEPYESHSYALDSSTEYRGLYKLDSANKLYCDGDIYKSNGTAIRKYNSMTISSENVIEVSTAYNNIKYYKVAKPSDMYSYGKYEEQFLLNTIGFTQGIATGNWDDANYINAIITRADTNSLWFGFAVGTTLEQAKSKLGGAVLLYEVALPTEESATPFSNPQFYDKFGTEEYVDYGVSQNTRDVAIPSGHETSYVKYH